ncbi:MAG: hypothetical protein V1767_00285 [Chloroflexota bacterium]
MGKNKKWVIVAVLVAAVVLAGSIGGIALAQTGTTNDQVGAGKTLLSRVATILGIDQQKVEDAFAQAQREVRDEALDAKLKALVDAGKLTQEQANQYKTWWQSKPNLPDGFGFMGPRGLKGMGGFRGFGGCPNWNGPAGIPAVPSTSTSIN